MPIEYSQLEQLARDQQAAAQQLQNRINGRLNRAMRELLGVARGVAHVHSGDLRDSLYIIAPSVAGDVTESSIAARVVYAEAEADRGGAHDYPARTIEEGQSIIQQLQDDVAALIAAAFVGQGID